MRSIAGVAALLIAGSCGETRPAPSPQAEAAPEHVLVEEPAPPATARASGRVLAPDGGVLQAFTIEVLFSNPHQLGEACARASFENAPDGAFELEGLPAGTLVIVAVADGFAPTLGAPFEAIPDARVDAGDLRLASGGALAGRVVDARNGSPVAGAAVEADMRSAFSFEPTLLDASTRTDAHGAFAFDHLTPGEFTLSARTPELATRHTLAVVEAGARTDADPMRLVPGATLSGVVLGPDGRPLAEATVQLTPAALSELGGHRQARTDAAGRYVLERVAPGGYVLSAHRSAPGPFAAIGDMRASQREITIGEEDRALAIDVVISSTR
jgi:protocatechuate 3,4-dioxygenase beta subunit